MTHISGGYPQSEDCSMYPEGHVCGDQGPHEESTKEPALQDSELAPG